MVGLEGLFKMWEGIWRIEEMVWLRGWTGSLVGMGIQCQAEWKENACSLLERPARKVRSRAYATVMLWRSSKTLYISALSDFAYV